MGEKLTKAGLNVRYRQLRGLLIHYGRRADWQVDRENERNYFHSRELITPSTVQDNKPGQRRCAWCELPIPVDVNKRKWCHVGCVKAYCVARGLTRIPSGQFVIRYGPCSQCGKKDKETTNELDHVVSLAVAYWQNDERARLRAYLTDNLQWLCSKCHKEKTRVDNQKASHLRFLEDKKYHKKITFRVINKKVLTREEEFQLGFDL